MIKMAVHYISLFVVFWGMFGVSRAADFDNSLSTIGKQFVAAIGSTTGFVFTIGNNYPPIEQDVTFWCIQPNDTKEQLDKKLDFKLPINFLIHGFVDSFHGGFLKTNNTGWLDSTSRIWAKESSSNVCAVDWSRLATYEYIIASQKHTRKVANHTSEFIKYLAKNGASIPQTTVAGHSLGAQISGFIGATLNRQLLAIYGLDPAGPGFMFPFSSAAQNRLDETDAKYVQCIHTARGTLGYIYKCGHADFYPNGGFRQPGCIAGICSHLRAVQLFRSSMNKQNVFKGLRCPDSAFSRVLFLRCNGDGDNMGIHSDKKMGSFYVTATAAEPYCGKCTN